MLYAIAKIQNRFLLGGAPSALFQELLDALLQETQSEYGFIGEVLEDAQGKFLRTYAISDISWDDETRRFYDDNIEEGLEFHNLQSLFGHAIAHETTVIANDPATDPRAGGLPRGHPAMVNFLGVPLFARDRMIGLAAVANRTGGYDNELVERLEPLTATCAALIHSFRVERARRQAAEERDRALRDLRGERRRLEEIIEGTDAGTWEWNPQTGACVYNERWAEMLGYRLADLEPLSIDTWRQLCHPDDLVKADILLGRLFTRAIDHYDCELRMRRRNGAWTWVHDRGKVVEWSTDGRPLKVAGTHIDISRKKEVEEGLRQARDAFETASRVKSEFLASMSHELRTPLNAVLGYGQMLLLDPAGRLDKTQREYIEHILTGGKILLALVNDILDLARIEADRLSIHLERFSVAEAVADCISQTQPLCKARNIDLVNDIGDNGSVTVFTDKVRFRQILINLLSNAVRYNKDDGRIILSASVTPDAYLRISVTDTGIGIPEEKRGQMFQLFERFTRDPMLAGSGAGVGLAICKMLVERLGGRIDYRSEVGKGSTFWFDMPLASNDKVLIWTDDLRVGVQAIDKDHQVIFALANRVSDSAVEDEDLAGVVQEMIDYTHHHFRREEAIMAACGYPDLEAHRAYHRKLEREVDDLAGEWRRDGGQETLYRLRHFLRNWWNGHIQDVDRTIAEHARGKELAIRDALDKID